MEAARHERRIFELGSEIFDLMESARPRPWQRTWWQERAMRILDRDQRLRTRVFQFVDCLPALGSAEDIADHLRAYLDDPALTLPTALRSWLRPGPAYRWRAEWIGRFARFAALEMAGRFITGHDVPSALRTVERLRRDGLAFTLDVLGESTTSDRAADRYAAVYHDLMDRLPPIARSWAEVPLIDRSRRGPMPRVNFSLKLTGLDPFFDPIDPDRAVREVGARLRPLFRHARETGAFVNIDMESTRYRVLTLELFRRLMMEDEFRDWEHVGIVLQAYLKDAEHDLRELLEWARRRGCPFTVRLVKGAYW
ncbi:MAG: L-glutamate gamma-semialdehyde dehydrogenase, partial [Planctomycetota bacterium]